MVFYNGSNKTGSPYLCSSKSPRSKSKTKTTRSTLCHSLTRSQKMRHFTPNIIDGTTRVFRTPPSLPYFRIHCFLLSVMIRVVVGDHVRVIDDGEEVVTMNQVDVQGRNRSLKFCLRYSYRQFTCDLFSFFWVKPTKYCSGKLGLSTLPSLVPTS